MSRTPEEEDKKVNFEHVELAHGKTEATSHTLGGEPERVVPHGKVDEAAEFLANAGHIEYTEADDRRVLRRIDTYVLIPMVIIYMMQQLDKSSLSYASVFNIQGQLHLVGTQFSWLASCVYVAQLIFQPLSSYAIIHFPLNYWLIFNMTSWGIVVVASAAAHNFAGLLVARILLGIFEATLAPTFIALCQTWWRRREQTNRVIAWNLSNAFAGIIGPLIAYGVGHAPTLKPYQSIFIALGAITLGCVPIVWWLMPASPMKAKFLDRGNDRYIALERLRDNNQGSGGSHQFKWDQCWEAFTDPKSYGWCLILFCCAFPSGGIGVFSGLIIQGLGFKDFAAILLTIPPAVIGLVFLLTATYITGRIRMRGPVLACLALFPIAGAIALRLIAKNKVNSRLGAFYVTYAFAALQPTAYAWATVNVAGQTKKTVVTAMLFVSQCVGNIGGPFVYRAQDKPNYYLGIEVDIAMWGVLILTTVSMSAYMRYLNKRNEKRREKMGRVGAKIDTSIMTVAESMEYHKKLAADMVAAGITARVNEDAFMDLTDLQNPDFMWAY